MWNSTCNSTQFLVFDVFDVFTRVALKNRLSAFEDQHQSEAWNQCLAGGEAQPTGSYLHHILGLVWLGGRCLGFRWDRGDCEGGSIPTDLQAVPDTWQAPRWMKRGWMRTWQRTKIRPKIGCVAFSKKRIVVSQGQWLIGLKGLKDPANLRGFRFLGKHAPHVRSMTPAFQGKANALMAIVVSLPTRKSRCRSKQTETMSWSIHQEGEAQHWSRLSTVQVDKTSQVTIATRRSFKCYGIPEGDIAGQMGSNMGKQCCSC